MEGVDSALHFQEGSGKVFLLCATNCPWELDSAFIRRFQRRIHVPLPDRCYALRRQRVVMYDKLHVWCNDMQQQPDGIGKTHVHSVFCMREFNC